MSAESSKTPAPKTHKTLEELFREPVAVEISRAQMHAAFQIPFAGTETTLSAHRTPGLKMVYHPGYGIIGIHKGTYFGSPSSNVIVYHA